MLLWLVFIFCAGIIIICGTNLSKYGDVIAEKTGLGRAWIGLMLLATITSLPELMTGISSVSFAGLPDLTAGDIMGSCVFNLMILALLDPMDKSSPIFSRVGQSHLLSGSFGVLLIGIAAVSIMTGGLVPSVGHIGLYTPVIIIVYAAGMRAVYFYEKRFINRLVAEALETPKYPETTLQRAAVLYAANAVIVVAVAIALPFIAGRLAVTTGLGTTFMGTVFVAVTTSLPEVVVSVSAVRMGAPDLAIGNLFGSNMFNIVILAIDDIFYLKGPLFSDISAAHASTAVMAILMTAVALVALTYRRDKKAFLRFGWDSIAMIAMGGLTVYFQYMMLGDR
ncbi:MAG: sodium:calcium antiporter [Deltaproteobacteria bacterium]|nr:sodium:calcium antiporter [Deltaproteobacteria bacterium]